MHIGLSKCELNFESTSMSADFKKGQLYVKRQYQVMIMVFLKNILVARIDLAVINYYLISPQDSNYSPSIIVMKIMIWKNRDLVLFPSFSTTWKFYGTNYQTNRTPTAYATDFVVNSQTIQELSRVLPPLLFYWCVFKNKSYFCSCLTSYTTSICVALYHCNHSHIQMKENNMSIGNVFPAY